MTRSARPVSTGSWPGAPGVAVPPERVGSGLGGSVRRHGRGRRERGLQPRVRVDQVALGAAQLHPHRGAAARVLDAHRRPAGAATVGVAPGQHRDPVAQGETSWTAPGTLARLAGGLGLLAGFAWRNARTDAPLVEPALLRVRAFRASIVGYLVFSAAFYALLLANVLYLTGVWRYDVLQAGFAVTPGPLLAAVTSALGGRLTDRFGARTVIVPGALLFAAGCALFAVGIGRDPAYLAHFLPATLLTGAGVGAVFSGLGVATVAELPPRRYATGSAVGTCARQIGAVLGLAALLSGLAGGADFHLAWTLMAAAACLTALVGLAVGLVRVQAPAPAGARRRPRPDRGEGGTTRVCMSETAGPHDAGTRRRARAGGPPTTVSRPRQPVGGPRRRRGPPPGRRRGRTAPGATRPPGGARRRPVRWP